MSEKMTKAQLDEAIEMMATTQAVPDEAESRLAGLVGAAPFTRLAHALLAHIDALEQENQALEAIAQAERWAALYWEYWADSFEAELDEWADLRP